MIFPERALAGLVFALCTLGVSFGVSGCGGPADIGSESPQLVFPDAPPLAPRHRNHSMTEAPNSRIRVFAAQRGDVTDLMIMRKSADGVWSAPELLALPKRETNTSPRFFPDGTLYYSSDATHPNRPGRKDLNIWRVAFVSGQPGTPDVLPDEINTGSSEDGFAPLGKNGAIFSSTTLGGEGGYDLYIASAERGRWQVEPFAHNTMMADSHPATSPDGKTLIWYAHMPREDVFGAVDLFASRLVDGRWTEPVNLGPQINSEGIDYGPGVSADGQTLFFSRDGRLYETPMPIRFGASGGSDSQRH